MDDMLTQVVRALRRQQQEFDLDLVHDVGGAGLLWSDQVADLRGRLMAEGAFRNVRLLPFNTDSLGDFAEAAETTTPRVGLLCIFLTDGTGKAWQNGAIYRWLRDWRGLGIVLIIHLLPAAMWNGSAIPIELVSHDLGQAASADWDPERIIPVVELRAASIQGWEPLLKGEAHGVVSGCAVLLPAHDTATSDQPPQGESPTAEERVQRFDVIATAKAKRLARQLSGRPLELTVMRDVQRDLQLGSDPAILAEILLGGLVYRASPPVTDNPAAPAEQVTFKFFDGVEKLLADQLESDEAPPSPTANVPLPRLVPTTYEASNGLAESDHPAPEATPLRIGFWGSPQSGKTTFLTVLDIDWRPSSADKEWRLKPIDIPTENFMADRIHMLKKGKLPDSSLIKVELKFKFMLRTRQRRQLRRRKVSAAEIQVDLELEDMPASSFPGDRPRIEDLDYLAEASAILYFFDATRDAEGKNRLHSFEFFTAVDAWLRRRALEDGSILDTYLPYHLAVCISKLDDPFVFRTARRYGCLQTDPKTGRPCVPGRHARRLFEALCREQMNPQSEALLDQLQHSFHPDRISFHVLSATGFLVKGGEVDLDDPSNVMKSDPDGPSLLRGELDPVNVVDPLVALIERINRAHGQAARP
jgi:hypothetical protein